MTSWRSRHRQWERDRNLRRKYGISRSQFDAIFEAQGRHCALCPATNPGWRNGWCVDHDHTTGEVRGLLCHDCNTRLGFYETSRHQFTVFERYLTTVRARVNVAA